MNSIKVNYRGINMYVWECPSDQHWVSHCVRTGGWETEQMDFIINEIADKSKNMIDVGGEIGSYSLVLSQHFNKIFTFEPNVNNHSLIQKSIEDGNIDNVYLYNNACGEEDGICSMSGPYATEVSVGTGDIKIVKLDDLIKDEVSFIKIDVEGHEFSVLKGCERIVNTYKPIIYLETHPSMVSTSQTDCEEFLTSKGYVVMKEMDSIDKFWIHR